MPTTGITNAVIIPKDGRMLRSTTPRSASKPFVVCSMSTKRFAGSKTSKTVQRLPQAIRPTSSGDGPHVSNEAPMQHTHPPVPVVSIVVKTEVRRSFTKPALAPDPGETRMMLKTSAPFSRLTSKDRSLSQKTISSKLTKVVEMSKEDVTRGYPTLARSTQLTTANEAPSRPSCVPRGRIPLSSVGARLASKGRQEVAVKAIIPRPRNPGIKPTVNIPTTRTAARAMVTGSCVKNPSVSERHPGVPSTQRERLNLRNPVKFTTENEPFPRPGCVPRVSRSLVDATISPSKVKREAIVKEALVPCPRNPGVNRQKSPINNPACRTRTRAIGAGSLVEDPFISERHPGVPSTPNERFTLHNPVIYPDINWSPPPSPVLSSFPSQSWAVAIGVDIERAKITTTLCGDGTQTSTRDTEKLGSSDIHENRCGASQSASSSPAFSPSSTIVSTPPNPDTCISGTDNTLEIGSSGKKPSADSPTECTAKIIPQSRNGSTFKDILAKIIERSQADSPAKNSDAESKARTTGRPAIEIARNLFSHSQSVPDPAAVKTTGTGTDVSQVRKLFVPPLEKGTRASRNPMIQKELEVLRARKMVAGGGVVDPRLEGLISLSAMAMATKHSTLSPD